jgi:DNA-binding protein HU-beta
MSTTKRQVISHADHAHPSTSKARAECRAAMAEGKPVALKKAAPAKKAPAAKRAPAKTTPTKEATAKQPTPEAAA